MWPEAGGLFPGGLSAGVFLLGGIHADGFAFGDEERHHDLEAGFERGLFPGRVGAATDGWSSIHHFERHLGRKDDVQQPAIQQQGFIFFVLFQKHPSLANLLAPQLELIKGFHVNEHVPVSQGVAVGDAAGFQWGNGHAFGFGEDAVGDMAGFEVAHSGGYPGWKPEPSSDIVRQSKAAHRDILGKDPELVAMHAGLECGVIGEKHPEMQMISFGPHIVDVHSPSERLKISSVEPFWRFLTGLLERI